MADYAAESVFDLLAEESLDSGSVSRIGSHHPSPKCHVAEDAAGALFDRDEAAGEGTSRCFEERKNNKRKGGDYVAAVERKPGKVPEDNSTRFFDDLLEKPCPNHTYPVKHLLKNCGSAKRWFGSSTGRGEQKKKPELEDANEKEKQDDVPETDGYLMIFGGPFACESRCQQKVTRREVFTSEPTTPMYLGRL